MAAMTLVLRKLHVMPRHANGHARARVHFERPVLDPKVRQWNDLIPDSEVSRLRYVADLDGGSACISRVILP